MEENLKRVTIQVQPETYERLNRLVRHGFRRHLMEKLVVLVLDAIEKDGEIVVGALMEGSYKLVLDREAA